MGSLELRVVEADQIIVGVLEDAPDKVAIALGWDGVEKYMLLECPPQRARQIAASLLNKADHIDGLS